MAFHGTSGKHSVGVGLFGALGGKAKKAKENTRGIDAKNLAKLIQYQGEVDNWGANWALARSEYRDSAGSEASKREARNENRTHRLSEKAADAAHRRSEAAADSKHARSEAALDSAHVRGEAGLDSAFTRSQAELDAAAGRDEAFAGAEHTRSETALDSAHTRSEAALDAAHRRSGETLSTALDYARTSLTANDDDGNPIGWSGGSITTPGGASVTLDPFRYPTREPAATPTETHASGRQWQPIGMPTFAPSAMGAPSMRNPNAPGNQQMANPEYQRRKAWNAEHAPKNQAFQDAANLAAHANRSSLAPPNTSNIT